MFSSRDLPHPGTEPGSPEWQADSLPSEPQFPVAPRAFNKHHITRASGMAQWVENSLTGRRCRRHQLDLWVRKIPWRRKWQPTPVFLPGESHGQRSLVGYSPWGHKELYTTEHTHCYVTKITFITKAIDSMVKTLKL